MNFLTINKTSKATIKQSFSDIANQLFNNYKLRVNNILYRLIDIEFYYHDKAHPDPYVHNHNHQKNSGTFYFHGSGIDLTMGNKEAYGGILIREIAKISTQAHPDKQYIEDSFHGPLISATEIFNQFHSPLETKPNYFHLEKTTPEEQKTIMQKATEMISTSRVGLKLKNEDTNEEYLNAKYRYLIFPHLSHKDKTKIAESMKEEGKYSVEQINKLMGSKFV